MLATLRPSTSARSTPRTLAPRWVHSVIQSPTCQNLTLVSHHRPRVPPPPPLRAAVAAAAAAGIITAAGGVRTSPQDAHKIDLA